MNWTEQAGKILQTWTDTQKQLVDSWLQNIQRVPEQFPGADVCNKSIDAWEKTLYDGVSAQSEWMQMVTRTFGMQRNVSERTANSID